MNLLALPYLAAATNNKAPQYFVQDATAHFYMMHQYESIPKSLEKFRVGNVPRDDAYVFHTPLTKEIRQRVNAILPPHQWWAPTSWYAGWGSFDGCLAYGAQCYILSVGGWLASGIMCIVGGELGACGGNTCC